LSKAFKREFGTSPGQYREARGGVAVLPARVTEAGSVPPIASVSALTMPERPGDA